MVAGIMESMLISMVRIGSEGGGWIRGPKLDQRDPNTPSGYSETPQYNSTVDPVTGKLIPLPISRGKTILKLL